MRNLRAGNGASSMTEKKDANEQWFLLLLAFLLTLVCIGSSSYIGQMEKVQVGSVAEKRYIAAADAVDEVTTQRLRDAAAESVGPIYTKDAAVEQVGKDEIEELFADLELVLADLGEDESFYTRAQEAPWKLPVVLNARELSAYQGMAEEERQRFAEDCTAALAQVYAEGITADALEGAKEQAHTAFAETAWSTSLKEMANDILSAAIEPNLLPDEAAMEAAREAKRAEVEDVMIRKNQKIVDEGEIITQDIYDRLLSLRLIGSANDKSSLLPLAASTLLTLLLFVAVALFFGGGRGNKRLRRKDARMLAVIYGIMLLILRLTADLTNFGLIPLGLFAMLVSLLIGRRIALVLNTFFGIVGSFIFHGDVQFLVYSVLVGTMGALLIQKTDTRRNMVPAAVAMGGIGFLSMLGVGLFFGDGYSMELLIKCISAAGMGLLSVVVAVGSLPFWEATFEVNTPMHLLELTNPNNELLRRLMLEAPGTYHHSLIVANLAETAIYEIGGNTALARAGAYYHDIGKLKNPQYFSENQAGYNPHDALAPDESAKIILRHTQDGAELGMAHDLPKSILAIIREHHGTSLVKFFYFKAVKLYGAENVQEADYRYPGEIPSSRESAVVMLADTVEAAVRSMLGSGKSLAEAEQLIGTLMKDKLDDGQLNNSALTIREMESIRRAFVEVFRGMYHERVAYPKQEEIQAARESAEKREDESSDTTD